MKNKTEVSSTGVCVRMSKAGLEGGGLGILEKRPPSPHSPPLSPPTSASTPPSQTKIKCESPTLAFNNSHTPSPRLVISPPVAGPGAEVKGKPGTPIPSGSAKVPLPQPNSASSDDTKPIVGVSTGPGGGRLTFFKEGKFLLELSHRTDMGAPAGWVPVKSKTYWPPPSSTTSTTTHHPLRHDTPNSQSVSDDCSSLNSSPWTSEHMRKQPVPGRNKAFVLQPVSLYWAATSLTQHIRKKVKRRRNPFVSIEDLPANETPSENSKVCFKRVKSECVRKTKEERKQRLEKWILLYGLKCGMKIETETTIHALFEKPCVASVEGVDPTFVSPRKRYLRQMESDDYLHRKKLHSGSNTLPPHTSGERHSSASTSTLPHPQPNKSAINSLSSSVYSIDSILNHESASRKNDSFLRTLLKPEPKTSSAQSRSSVVKDRVNDVSVSSVKVERQEYSERGGVAERLEHLSAAQSDATDTLIDLNRLASERYDLSRYGTSMASLYSLSPYLDPRYMMLQSLVPPVSSQHPEMAQAIAAATAAAATVAGFGSYQLANLHPSLATAQYPHLLQSAYNPQTSLAAQLLRSQPHSSRSSPHPVPHSPSPKPQVPSTPVSPHHLSRGASPRGAPSPWQPPPSLHSLSPHRPLASPLPSPPPQDAPLNLSKPRNHVRK